MNSKTRNWLIAGVVILAGFFTARYINSGTRGTDISAETSVGNETLVVSLEHAEVVEASGTLEAHPFASLSWKTAGVVESVNIQTGDFVNAGDILLSLQPQSTSSSIVSAQAELVNAQKDLEDLLETSDTKLAHAVIELREAQEVQEKAAKYVRYLENEDKIPQTSTTSVLVSTRNGYQYEYKTKSFKGPAPEEWIIEADNDLALRTAELEEAQLAYDRLKDGPNAQDVLAAQARVDAAQTTVNSLYVIAPFDGQVLWVENVEGDLINTNNIVVHIADMDHLFVDAQVDESDVIRVQVGNQVQVTLEAESSIPLTGEVVSVNPVGEEIAGLVKYSVRISLDPIVEEIVLLLGATADVIIEVGAETAELGVPIELIQNDSEGEYVWVVQSDGSTERVNISSGDIVDDFVIAYGDISEGDILQGVERENTTSRPGPFGSK